MARPIDQSSGLLQNVEPEVEHDITWAELDAHEKELGFSDAPNTARGKIAQLLSRLLRKARGLPVISWPEAQPLLLSIGVFLIPSFLQRRLRPADQTQKPQRQHDTTYLDGMRGISALIVYFCHFAMSTYWPELAYGYGYHDAQHPSRRFNSIWRMPIFRLIYDGDPMVTTFFVVSGYALSYKPLQDMRSERYDKLLDTMTSATFRRALRLYVPVAAATFIIAMSAQFGLYEFTRPLTNPDVTNPLVKGVDRAHIEPEANIFVMFGKWIYSVYRLMEVWNWGPRWDFKNFSGVLWTIPTEFIGSMFLFIAQLGVAKMRPWVRMVVMALLTLVAFQKTYWAMALFFSGMLVAELELERVDARRANPELNVPQSATSTKSLCWIGVFILGLFFMSQPDDTANTPGWRFLSTFIIENMEVKRFYTSIGAFLLVLATSNVEALKRIYDNPVSAYLGKISFALYLTHTLLVSCLGYAWMAFFWSIWGYNTPTKVAAACVGSAVATLPFAIWLADAFWRAVDIPSIRLARQVEQLITSRPSR